MVNYFFEKVNKSTIKSHKIIIEYIKSSILSTFHYSQVVQDPDSYTQLPWQQYLTDIIFKYIFGDKIEIPTHTYKIHNSMTNISF